MCLSTWVGPIAEHRQYTCHDPIIFKKFRGITEQEAASADPRPNHTQEIHLSANQKAASSLPRSNHTHEAVPSNDQSIIRHTLRTTYHDWQSRRSSEGHVAALAFEQKWLLSVPARCLGNIERLGCASLLHWPVSNCCRDSVDDQFQPTRDDGSISPAMVSTSRHPERGSISSRPSERSAIIKAHQPCNSNDSLEM